MKTPSESQDVTLLNSSKWVNFGGKKINQYWINLWQITLRHSRIGINILFLLHTCSGYHLQSIRWLIGLKFFKISWIWLHMSNYIFKKLYKILNRCLTTKFGQGVHYRDFIYRACNCSDTSKVSYCYAFKRNLHK